VSQKIQLLKSSALAHLKVMGSYYTTQSLSNSDSILGVPKDSKNGTSG